MLDLVSATQFRSLVREHKFGKSGETYPPHVNAKHRVPLPSIAPYLQLISPKFTHPLEVQVEEDDKYFSISVYLIKEEEEEDEGFGSAPVSNLVQERSKQFVHSFVSKSTGEVYLPNDEETGPELGFGVRCNVNDLQSCLAYGLDANSGKLRVFNATASLLLDLGVDVDSGDAWGETALMQACLYLELESVEWLVDVGGASPNKQTLGSKSHALFRALEAVGALETRLAVLRILVERGAANCNLANKHGWTPLHCAYRLDLPLEVIDYLLQQGRADPDALDCLGKRPDEYKK